MWWKVSKNGGNFEYTVLVLTETDEKEAEQCLNLLDPREEAQPEGILFTLLYEGSGGERDFFELKKKVYLVTFFIPPLSLLFRSQKIFKLDLDFNCLDHLRAEFPRK